MYHFFQPLLHIDFGTNTRIHHYLLLKEEELFARLGCSESSPFLSDHIHFVKSSIRLIQKQVYELTAHLQYELCLPTRSFSLHNTTYYSHLNSYSYFLFSYLQYDALLKKHAFSIFELDVSTPDKKVRQCSLAFSSAHISDLLKYPIDLKIEIEKFDTMQSIEQSKKHLNYCQKLLMDYFDVNELVNLYDIEESLLLKYIGDPLVLLRTIQKKHNDNRIKLSLNPLTLHEIDASLIELIHLERRVVKQEQLRNFLSADDFNSYTKQLQQTKARMMCVLDITQEQLNVFMGCLPADFL
ncbi:hypothetical protein AAGS61_10180 [Lysinibacillus sp. KU-BSD001]|uniref:hypothetical protein n=1 Tax=Lysinibacillus sp. KU-BSD001 TaxID=3141328 RepID=UPI0036EBFCBB